jgi:hypothetical protein
MSLYPALKIRGHDRKYPDVVVILRHVASLTSFLRE